MADTQTATECFDYIMNTPQAYALLGSCLPFLERLAKRLGRTPEETLSNWHSYAVVKGTVRRWYNVAFEAIKVARKDYEKNFPEEERPSWLDCIEVQEVVRIALTQRDRF